MTIENNDPSAADFTRERAEIWRLGWPILIGMGSHIFFHLIDLYWVGYLGTNALSGVAVAGSLMMLLWTASRIAHIGGVAVISQAFGRKDSAALRNGAVDSIIVGTVTGIVMVLLIYPFLKPVVSFYGLGPDAYSGAIAYLSVSLLGVPFMFFMEGVTAYAIGVGETRILMILGIMTSSLNMVLDPILIFGWLGAPKMGIAGAALASLAATLLFLFLLINWQRGHLGIRLSHFKTTFSRIRTIVTIGFPAAIRDINRPLSVMIMIRLVSSFGDETVAAYGLSIRLMGVVVIYMVSLTVALTTLIGKLIGEKKVERAHALLVYGIRGGLVIHLIVVVVLVVFAGPILSLFDESGVVVSIGVPIIRIFAVMMTFALISRVTSSAFSGSGYTKPIMVASVISRWLVMIPLAYVAVNFYHSALGAWMAVSVAGFVDMLILVLWYLQGGWKTHSVKGLDVETVDVMDTIARLDADCTIKTGEVIDTAEAVDIPLN